jgi:hypothetical protein
MTLRRPFTAAPGLVSYVLIPRQDSLWIGTPSSVGSPFALPNGLLEQDAIVVPAATQLLDIEMDLTNLTQITTVCEYSDSVKFTQAAFPTDFDTNAKKVMISHPQKGLSYKITLTSTVAEGAIRNVPFTIMTRPLA